jgi:hypothetical protein
MVAGLDPFTFLVVSISGWINQRQQQVIEYLIEENRVLREQIGNRRMRFSNDQRCRLAAKAKKLGRRILAQVVCMANSCSCRDWRPSAFSLLDSNGNLVGTAVPGSTGLLETRTATLDLTQSSFQGTGPTGPSVTVNFAVRFRAPATGQNSAHVYHTEVLATDILGQVQGPQNGAPLGRITAYDSIDRGMGAKSVNLRLADNRGQRTP